MEDIFDEALASLPSTPMTEEDFIEFIKLKNDEIAIETVNS